MLEGALAADNRLIARMTVDGRDRSEVADDAPLSGITLIEVTSASVEEAVAQLRSELVRETESAAAGVGALAVDVLRSPWEAMRPRCLALAESCGRLLEGVPGLVAHAASPDGGSGLEGVAGSLAASLARWLDVVEGGDAAFACLSADFDLCPALRQFASELNAEMRDTA